MQGSFAQFERSAIPFAEIGSHIVHALSKAEQFRIGVGCRLDRFIGKEKFVQGVAVERRGRFHLRLGKTIRLRIRIGIVNWLGNESTRPKTQTTYFVRVRFSGNRVWKMRYTARMRRRRSSGKARH